MTVARFVLGLLSLAVLASPAVPAEQTAVVPPDFTLARALPAALAGWEKSRDDEVFDRDSVFDYLDGGGELYLAFDFRFVFVREYAKPDAPAIVVELYQM